MLLGGDKFIFNYRKKHPGSRFIFQPGAVINFSSAWLGGMAVDHKACKLVNRIKVALLRDVGLKNRPLGELPILALKPPTVSCVVRLHVGGDVHARCVCLCVFVCAWTQTCLDIKRLCVHTYAKKPATAQNETPTSRHNRL